MQILAEVRKVRRYDSPKLKAEVSLIVSEPDEIVRIRLFDVHDKQGLIDQFERLEGQPVRVPIEVEIYNGRLSYSLAYGAIPTPLQAD